MNSLSKMIKAGFAGLALAAAAIAVPASAATPIVFNPGPYGTGVFSNTSVIGDNTDLFSFSIPDASYATGSLTSVIDANAGADVDIVSIILDFGQADQAAFQPIFCGLCSPSSPAEFWLLDISGLSSGLHTLAVQYQSNGTPVAPGSYTGTLNLTTPVPEAATWAMMVLGFGIVGFGMRARRSAVVYA